MRPAARPPPLKPVASAIAVAVAAASIKTEPPLLARTSARFPRYANTVGVLVAVPIVSAPANSSPKFAAIADTETFEV